MQTTKAKGLRGRRRLAVLATTMGLALAGAVAVPLMGASAQENTACTEPAWDAGAVYLGDDVVSHGDRAYRAKWWTRGEEPGTTGEWGVWEDLGACGGDPDPTSPDPTDTTPPDPSGDQEVVGYWHNWDEAGTGIRLSEVPQEYTMIHVAFAFEDPTRPGGISFDLEQDFIDQGYTEADFKQDIADLKAQGREVVISIGGANHTVEVDSEAKADNLARTTLELMDEYGFAGIDIDLEHGIHAQYMEMALRQIHQGSGGSFVYTMSPQTADFASPDKEYRKLATATKDILTLVHMQYYNSGTMFGCDGEIYAQETVDFLTALACIQIEDMGLDPTQVAFGLPSIPDSAPAGGYMDPNDIVKAIDCLETGANCGSFVPYQPYGEMGGAMTWSINWDLTNGYDWGTTLGARLN
ncbi:glycosyl hydrolase family 18 protein [Salininema proteolyticum]|uniref:Glycosyl hydrolase family 18 protein n=1 Tax=Salininema proteolyticum TaxID=1607685 RepID=A0ABV8U3H0_9ACTN